MGKISRNRGGGRVRGKFLFALLCTTAISLTFGVDEVTALAGQQAEAQPPVGQSAHSSGVPELPNPVMLNLPPVGEPLAKNLKLGHVLAQRTTNYNHASLSQTKNIELLAKRLNGVVVPPNTTFSYYNHVGPYTADNGYQWGRAFSGDRIVPSMGGGVCQGASTLYSAVLRTGLPVVERHNHSLTVPYLPPGEDATVSGSYLNFQFRNNRTTPVLIAASTDSAKRLLTVALWGAEPPPNITVHHGVLEQYPYRVMQRCSPNVATGQTKVLFPGQMGGKVKTWLEIQTTQGTDKKYVGVDGYRPSPRVVEIGRGAAGCK
jgi:vancomycin resistance protein VanW